MVSKLKTDDIDSVESIEMGQVSEESEEEDDEVFTDLNTKENGSAKKPLIKSKKNGKKAKGIHTEIRTGKPHAKRCCGPVCCIFLAFKSLMGIIAITIILTNYLTHSNFLFWSFGSSESVEIVGCQSIEIVPVWQVKIPKLIVEGSTRMLHVNNDQVLDVVLGFGTGADGYDIPEYVCDIYFDGQKPCLGGIIALDGKTGVEIWRLWTKHEIFALTCQSDLDQDGFTDCLAGGRAGVFLAVSIKDGKELWSFGDHAIQSDLMSVFAAQIVQDVDNDGIEDVLAVHGGDALSDPNPSEHNFGRLILFSGKTGRLLQWMPTPDSRESFYPPQISVTADGRQIIIFGTGSSKHGGGLYVKALIDLYRKNVTNIKMIYKDEDQGITNPAALADINNDGILDIILASMHENVLAFDGATFTNIWNVSMESHQTASSVSVGYFDSDEIPDFMVKYSYGDQFPVFEYEKTVVLSGKNGSEISDPIINSLSMQSTPISISMEGYGNDMFLHWSINCMDHKGQKVKYAFRASAHMYEKSQADLCRSLFGTRQDAKLMVMSKKFQEGISIYNSTDWESFEHLDVPNTSAMAAKYMEENPDLKTKLDQAEDDYSVLPYKKKDFDNYIKLLQEENEREYNGQPSIIDPSSLTLNENLLGNIYDTENDSNDNSVGIPVFQEEALEDNNIPEKRVYNYPNSRFDYQPADYPSVPAQFPQYSKKEKRARLNRRLKRGTDKSFQGIHKQSATASLAPSLIPANDTIDVVFPTYWVYPPKLDILQQEDMKCVERELRNLQDKSQGSERESTVSKDIDDIETKCLRKNKHLADDSLTYETPSDYDPLSINMGQMIVYRFSLRCICDKSKLSYNQKCANILPYQKQGWPAYMGATGDGKFKFSR